MKRGLKEGQKGGRRQASFDSPGLSPSGSVNTKSMSLFFLVPVCPATSWVCIKQKFNGFNSLVPTDQVIPVLHLELIYSGSFKQIFLNFYLFNARGHLVV